MHKYTNTQIHKYTNTQYLIVQPTLGRGGCTSCWWQDAPVAAPLPPLYCLSWDAAPPPPLFLASSSKSSSGEDHFQSKPQLGRFPPHLLLPSSASSDQLLNKLHPGLNYYNCLLSWFGTKFQPHHSVYHRYM